MSANGIDVLLRNNTGNKDKNILIDSFVVRTKIFNNIFSEIRSSTSDKPEQNYLLIGQRGSGKTTLLYRLKYAIEDDNELNKWLLPVVLPEEQYNITELLDLWETVAIYLEEVYKWEKISIEINKLSAKKNAEELAYEILEKSLKKKSKKIIIFIENINQFFKKITNQEQKRLREVLLTATNLRFIGSSTSFFEEINDYSKPFYNFFKVYQLKGLNKEESNQLLLKLGNQYGKLPAIENIIKNNPNRIESLRRLTGGTPRLMSYLYQIFIDNQKGKAITDLYSLLDELTFLYKAELDQLSTQQQKIIDIIARNWDAISAKEIAIKTRINSKQVSSVLNALKINQIIEVVPTKTKNNLYRLRERLLNIWYLMRFGKKSDKENIIRLVQFYDTWCYKTTLPIIEDNLNNLKVEEYHETYGEPKYQLIHEVNLLHYEGNNFNKEENAFIASLICLFNGAFLNKNNDRKRVILEQFEKYSEEMYKWHPLLALKYAKLLLWNGQIEKSNSIVIAEESKMNKDIEGKNEVYNEVNLSELADYFILLISKGQYNAAYSLFSREELNYKQILKPVYFALMNYMKEEYPQEYLKAGEELRETIEEIISKIEEYKVKYN